MILPINDTFYEIVDIIGCHRGKKEITPVVSKLMWLMFN
jgi:hypothetical protein